MSNNFILCELSVMFDQMNHESVGAARNSPVWCQQIKSLLLDEGPNTFICPPFHIHRYPHPCGQSHSNRKRYPVVSLKYGTTSVNNWVISHVIQVPTFSCSTVFWYLCTYVVYCTESQSILPKRNFKVYLICTINVII